MMKSKMKGKIIGMLMVFIVVIMILSLQVSAGERYYFTIPNENYEPGQYVTLNGVILHETSSNHPELADKRVSVTVMKTPSGQNVQVTIDGETASALTTFSTSPPTPDQRVSAHLIVARNGDFFLPVNTEGDILLVQKQRTSHSGPEGNNFFGVEFANTNNEQLTPEQIDAIPAVIRLFQDLGGADKYMTHNQITQAYPGTTDHTDGDKVKAAFLTLGDQNYLLDDPHLAQPLEKTGIATIQPGVGTTVISGIASAALASSPAASTAPATAALSSAASPASPQPTCSSQRCKEIDQVWTQIRIFLNLPQNSDAATKVWDKELGWIGFIFITPQQSKAQADQWNFQSGIRSQWNDASDELLTLLSCIRPYIPQGVGQISSISSSQGLANCQGIKWTSACVHAQTSSHFGCSGQSKKSLGVDFGDQQDACAIVNAAMNCGITRNHMFGPAGTSCQNKYGTDPAHANHLHISVETANCD